MISVRRLMGNRSAVCRRSARTHASTAVSPALHSTRAWYVATAAVTATVATMIAKPSMLKSRAHAEVAGLSPEQLSDASALVMEQFHIPLVPATLQEKVVAQAVLIIAAELPKRLTQEQMNQVSNAMDGVSAGISPEAREKLVKDLAGTLAAVPLVPEKVRTKLVTVIVDVLLGDVTVTHFSAGTGKALLGGASTLMSEEGRLRLTTKLNEKINIPGISEEQEKVIIGKGVDLLGGALESLIPSSWRSSLQGATAEEITAFKAHIVEVLEAKVPLPMVSAEVKDQMFGGVVDTVFEMFLDSSGMDGVMLAPEVQLERVLKVEADTIFELEGCKRAAKRREAGIRRRLVTIEQQKGELKKEIGHTHMVHSLEHGLVRVVALGGVSLLGWYFYSKNLK